MKVVVLGSDRYSFLDKTDGHTISGQNIFYIDPELPEDDGRKFGLLPLKVPCTIAAYEDITKAPAIYDVDFRQRPDAKGRPVLTLAKATFVKEIKL